MGDYSLPVIETHIRWNSNTPHSDARRTAGQNDCTQVELRGRLVFGRQSLLCKFVCDKVTEEKVSSGGDNLKIGTKLRCASGTISRQGSC